MGLKMAYLFFKDFFQYMYLYFQVTFTALALTPDQYTKMMYEGKLKDDIYRRPKLYISKSYDYLIQADRSKLTQALLTIGYIQNYSFEELVEWKIPMKLCEIRKSSHYYEIAQTKVLHTHSNSFVNGKISFSCMYLYTSLMHE